MDGDSVGGASVPESTRDDRIRVLPELPVCDGDGGMEDVYAERLRGEFAEVACVGHLDPIARGWGYSDPTRGCQDVPDPDSVPSAKRRTVWSMSAPASSISSM